MRVNVGDNEVLSLNVFLSNVVLYHVHYHSPYPYTNSSLGDQ